MTNWRARLGTPDDPRRADDLRRNEGHESDLVGMGISSKRKFRRLGPLVGPWRYRLCERAKMLEYGAISFGDILGAQERIDDR